jgi:hypothetical protein
MRETRDLRELVDWLRPDAAPRAAIAVDGANGSGKTVVADFVAAKLGLVPIHVDSYLTGDGQKYSEQVRSDPLRHDVKVRMSLGLGVIVDAVGALWLMESIGLAPTRHVYVRLEAQNGSRWKDDLCDPARIEEAAEVGDVPPEGLLDRYVFDYHRSIRPLSRADFLFVRIADDPDANF